MWGNKPGVSKGMFPSWLRSFIGPLVLILITVPFSFMLVHASNSPDLKGSLFDLLVSVKDDPLGTILACWQMPTGRTLRVLGAFTLFQLINMRLMPGKKTYGPPTPMDHVPEYTANGMQCFVATLLAFIGLSNDFGYGDQVLPEYLQFKTTILYEEYPRMMSFMPIVALFFCAFLVVKGYYFPSGPDHGTNGNIVVDFYWGTELYPRILGWDVKVFTNCRFGLILWALLPMSFAAHQYEVHGAVGLPLVANLVLQLVYLAKFYWWEAGYFKTIDIMHDRAGYYICWGCLCWVPTLYICHSWYITKMVDHGVMPLNGNWHPWLYFAIIVAGIIAIYINYDVDRQRGEVREKNGDCMVWGKKAEIIRATYFVAEGKNKGQERKSILLTSGWWGVARHFNYVPELSAAFLWTVSAGFSHVFPWCYLIFLTFLLFDRAFRDDARCREKYGKFYEEYCRRVPYLIIPGIV